MSESFLILAPRGRDAKIVEQLLLRGGMGSLVCSSMQDVHDGLTAEAGGLLFTEEGLAVPDLAPLLDWFAGQPSWSDIPVILLASKQTGKRSAIAAGVLDRLGNVVILERPINAETLLSAVKSALRVRRRQYQARTYLQEREENERLLQDLNGNLERRVQERARELDEARETLAFALDSAGMGSWDLDLTTGAARRTLQHDQIFGYPSQLEQWDRPRFLQHVDDEDRANVEASFAKAEAAGVLDVECRIRRADGQLRWIAIKGKVAYSHTRTPERMAGVVMDISERRFAEDALRQSQKMQAIGQLTGGLAHDFNNLLTGITASLEMMQNRIAQGRLADVGRYVTAAQGAATRAAALTHRLLAFSRRQTLDPKPTDMNRLAAGMEDLIRRTVGPVIHMETAFAENIWPTLCDPNQLENALLNFCINARDAMPDGGRLTLATANTCLDRRSAQDQDMVPGEYVVLCVSDTGSGMPPEIVARAFDPFFTTKPLGTGTGLGLSMAYGFARQSGGQVRITSDVGKGTMIRLYLPRHHEAEAAPRVEGTSIAPPPAQQGETVLVVDDERTVRMLVTEALEDLGYAALEAGDSTSALETIQSQSRIDLLITDVGLPGLNGRQLADAARGIRPKLKVMFITGYAENAALGEGQPETGMHILTKPFSIADLTKKIRHVIGDP